MNSKVALRLNNETTKPIVIWIEPLGEDYTMLPNDAVAIVPSDEEFSSSELGRPSIYFRKNDVIVYTFFQYVVYFNDVAVECGHQRLLPK